MTATDQKQKQEQAQQLFEQGETLRDIGQAVGVSHEWVRRNATKHGWQRQDHQESAGFAQTAAARARAQQGWADRRANEANEAGSAAGEAREALMAAIRTGDDKVIRAVAVAYGILIDKAQLLSGAATERTEQRNFDQLDTEIEQLLNRRAVDTR